MKAFAALFDTVPGILWAAICAGLFAWGGINAMRVGAIKTELAELKKAHAQAIAQATEDARIESERLQRIKDEAINKAQTRAQENAVAAGRARTELDRLRNAIAKGATPSADPACKATADRATALGDVLGECSGELTEMGRKADAHASDLRTFYDAWPAQADFQKRLDTFTNTLKGQ
jgi:ribosomal protein L16 Arg81 hydroxylase